MVGQIRYLPQPFVTRVTLLVPSGSLHGALTSRSKYFWWHGSAKSSLGEKATKNSLKAGNRWVLQTDPSRPGRPAAGFAHQSYVPKCTSKTGRMKKSQETLKLSPTSIEKFVQKCKQIKKVEAKVEGKNKVQAKVQKQKQRAVFHLILNTKSRQKKRQFCALLCPLLRAPLCALFLCN